MNQVLKFPVSHKKARSDEKRVLEISHEVFIHTDTFIIHHFLPNPSVI